MIEVGPHEYFDWYFFLITSGIDQKKKRAGDTLQVTPA